MKQLYVLLLLFLGESFSFSQEIVCEEMQFFLDTAFSSKYLTEPNLRLIEGNATEENGWDFKVGMKMVFENPDNDTIVLETAVRCSLLGPRNLNVRIIDQEGNISYLESWIEHQTAPQSSSDIQLLKFILSNKANAMVYVEYIVTGTMLFRYQPENTWFYSIQQQYEYFYPKDIPIKKVKFFLPDRIKYFLSCTKKNAIIEDIKISFIDVNHYVKRTIDGANYMLNIYFPDDFVPVIDSCIAELERYMHRFSLYLSHEKQSDIVFINWRDDKNRRAFGESLGSYIICDINFKGKDLLHEIIHSFFPIKIENGTKGEFFVKESIVEWIALFLSDAKVENSRQNSQFSISLYDVEVNNHLYWDMIYLLGPLIIEKVALEYDRDKMASIIISFLESNKDKLITYERFIDYLSEYLPRSLVIKMDTWVKSNLFMNK